MAHTANRYHSNRSATREFRALVAAIVYHAAEPTIEPRTRNPFVCPTCNHTRELCICAPFYRSQRGR